MKRKKVKKVPILFTFLLLIILIFGCLYLFKGVFTKHREQVEKPEVIKESSLTYTGKMTIAGNVLINSNMWYDTVATDGSYDYKYVFENIKDLVKPGVNIYTQQSIVGGKELGASINYDYNSPLDQLLAMRDIGFNIVSLASYHAFDRDVIGVTNSVKNCKENALFYSGISDKLEDRLTNNKITKNGITYGLLSYTLNTDEAYTDTYLIDKYSDLQAKADIEAIKDDVDVIIVSIDWSDNTSTTVTESQKQIATYLSELGVNILIGNNSNVVEPIDKINNMVVFYSLGNLLSGHTSVDSRISMISDFDVEVIKTGDKKEVNIKNINVSLIFAYNQFKTNYKVIPFSKITTELPNSKTYYDKYSTLIKGDKDYINVYKVGE